jgi:hypothetical protein
MGANITINDVVVLDASSWLQAPREHETVKEISHDKSRLDVVSKSTPGTAAGVAAVGNRRKNEEAENLLQETCWGSEKDAE